MKIFGKLQTKILVLLFLNEEREFYIREIALKLGCSPWGAQKELEKLASANIVKSQYKGKTRLFSVDKTNPAYQEIRNLLLKTSGIPAIIKQELSVVKGLKESFIYGSVAKGEFDNQSDIDLLVVGKIDYSDLNEKLKRAEEMLNREINAHIMSSDEYKKRLKEHDPYLTDVEGHDKIYLVKEGEVV